MGGGKVVVDLPVGLEVLRLFLANTNVGIPKCEVRQQDGGMRNKVRQKAESHHFKYK